MNYRLLFLILFAYFALSSVTVVFAANNSVNYPNHVGYVNDYANIIDSSTELELEQMISDFEKNNSVEIAVVTVSDLQGTDIETYAVELFKKWGIGKKKEDNGVLLLIAVKERKVRIEVGYGLEYILTDLKTKEVIDNVIVPDFKEENYDDGIYYGVLAITQIIEDGNYSPSLVKAQNNDFEIWSTICLTFVIIFIIILIIWKFGSGFGGSEGGGHYGGGRSGGSGGGWSSGGSSSGGFGGGRSGGGGSSGGW
ncbi:TPM domain-containing protein [Candidatus Micrarchaeota archaeon]|nr:TPM domain-containing protein [Candidatus Micrarchaeota archaeon]